MLLFNCNILPLINKRCNISDFFDYSKINIILNCVYFISGFHDLNSKFIKCCVIYKVL